MKVYTDCLDRMGRTLDGMLAWLTADGGQIPFGVIMSGLALAVLVSPWVSRAYGRRVRRFMAFRELTPPPSAWWARRSQGPVRRREASPAASADDNLIDAMARRKRRLRWATGLAMLTLWILLLTWPEASGGSVDINVRVAQGMVMLLLLLVPVMVNLQPHGYRRWLLGAGAVMVAPAVALTLVTGAGLADGIFNMFCFYVVSAHRTWRALCLPIFVLLLGLMVGVGAGLVALAPMQCVPPTQLSGEDPGAGILMILFGSLMGFALALWATGRTLAGMNTLMRRGWVSDISWVALAGAAYVVMWQLTNVHVSALPAADRLALGAQSLAAALVVYALVLAVLPAPRHGRSLLMLRVFSRDRRAEGMLDELQSRWRLAGPVLQIAGPDLARLNLNLHSFIHFATGRTHELFQPGVVPAEVLAQSLQLTPDREGRFRVNEVFCFDTAWRGVVAQLLQLADGVLLDLRGFNSERSGTTFEVEQLAALGLLPRVVAVGDEHTDWAWFDARVAAASPGPVAPLALRVDARAPGALQQCLAQLMAVSDAPRAG